MKRVMSPGREEAILKAAKRKGIISDDQLRSCLASSHPLQSALDSGFLSEDDVDGLKLMGSFAEDPDLLADDKATFNPSYWDDFRGKKFGRYELVSRIGEGATALVIRARDPSLGRDIALKILKGSGTASPETRDRFLREARAMAKLRHPNIIAVHEVGQEQGWYFLAMDFVPGSSFDQALAEHRLGMDSILDVMEKVARACHYAHKNGVIHRDLKPENILLDDKLNPYLTDFGLARLEAEGKGLTQTGTVMGTPMYMSPEHLSGRSDNINAQSDIYSLGVIFYEAATGRVPFDGDNISAVYAAIQVFEPVRPRGINAKVGRDLEAVIVKAMERDPHHRYQDAEELANDISNLRQGLAVKATQVSTLRFTMRKLRRHGAVIVTAAVLTTAAVGALLVFQSRTEREKDALQAVSDAVVRTTRAIEQYDLAMVLPPTDLSSKHQELDECVLRLTELTQDPHGAERAELFFELGRAQHRRMKYEEAVQSFHRALAVQSDHALAHFERARTLIDDYLDRLRSIPGTMDPGSRLSLARQNQPLLSQALEDLKLVTDRRLLSSLQLDYAQALAFAYQGEPQKAIAPFQTLLAKLDPGKDPKLYGDARLHLGAVYYQQGMYTEAIQEFKSALQVQKCSLNLLLNCGVTILTRVENQPNTPEKSRELDEAESYLKDAVKVAPDSYRVYNNYGNLLTTRIRMSDPIDPKLYALAMSNFDMAIKLASHPALPTSNRGDLIFLKLERDVWSGTYDEPLAKKTIEELRAICKNYPQFSLAHLVLSSLLYNHLSFLTRKGRWNESEYSEAFQLANKAIDLNPRSTGAHHKIVQLGMVKLESLRDRGQFDEATYSILLTHARKEAELSPTQALSLHSVAIVCTLKIQWLIVCGESDDKLWNEALRYARKALEFDPDFKPALLSVGNLMVLRDFQRISTKNLIEGEEALRRLLELDPNYSIGWNSLGNLLQRRYVRNAVKADDPMAEEALRAYDRALAIFPQYIEPTNNKGVVYLARFLRGLGDQDYRQEDLDQANQWFQKALQWSPAYSAAYQNLALVNERAALYLNQKGQDPNVPISRAVDAFEKYLAIVPGNVDYRFRFGRLLTLRVVKFAGSDAQRAEQVLNAVLDKNKSHAGAYLERGKLRIHLKRFKEAKEDLEISVDLASGNAAEATPLIERCKKELENEH